MSTPSSIWLGESDGKTVHIYWEFADREVNYGHMAAPIYIAVDAGDANQQIAVRLPKDIAVRLLTVLSSNPADFAQIL